MKSARIIALFVCLGFSGCYFNQACPQDLFERLAHEKQGCVADIKKQEDLELLLILSILSGGFPGSKIDTAEEAGETDEGGGAGVGGT